jgi:hypothetical protein
VVIGSTYVNPSLGEFHTFLDFTPGVDVLDLGNGSIISGVSNLSVASAVAGASDLNAAVNNGKLVLSGDDAGLVDSLPEWIDVAKSIADANPNGILFFEFSGSTYTYQDQTPNDALLKLVGVTGIQDMTNNAGLIDADSLYVF